MTSPSAVQVKIPFILASHQAVVRNSRKRHRVMACGRRSGKTLGAVYMTVEHLTTHRDQVAWWVAPTFGLTRKGMRETVHFLRNGQNALIKSIQRVERRIEFTNGSFLEFHTAENPDSLVGEGLDWLVVDEAGLIANDEIWPKLLRPALADREGRALFISSPRGRNWFYEVFREGQSDDSLEWQSWNIPTSEAGFVRASELEEIKRTTPVRIWEQEYLAKFLDSGGDVFRKVEAAIAPARPGRFVVLGVDLARTKDWTVIWAANELGEWVGWERFHDLDWSIQKPRIVGMYGRLQASRLLLDTTGMHVGADAVVAELRAEGLAVEPIVLTGSSKRAIVENQMVRFDQGSTTIPDDPVVLDEFKRFTFVELPSQNMRFAAPPGHHDDIVIAHGLALWGIRQFQGRALPKPKTEVERLIEQDFKTRLSASVNPWLA